MLNQINQGFRSFSQLRWFLLLVFPMVCIAAITQGATVIATLAYSGIAMFSCALLLRRMNSLTPLNVSIWLVLGLFIAFYFLRYMYLLFDFKPVSAIQPDTVFKVLKRDVASLHQAYSLTTLAFSVFCCGAAMLLGKEDRSGARTPQGAATVGAGFINALVFVILMLMMLLGYVAHVYHIGQMGIAPGEPLPFRLKGVVFYGRLVVLPLLMLTLIYLGGALQRPGLVRLGLVLLVVHGISDVMLRGSRSSLLLCVLVIVFLAANGGLRVRRAGIAISSAIAVVAILLMPVIMQYRILRFTSGEGMLVVMGQALNSAGEGIVQLLGNGLMTVYWRIPGIETMWAMLSLKVEPLGKALFAILASPFGVTGYLNFGVYLYPPESNTLFAPGYVGWWYLAGGNIGVAVGAVALAFICVVIPRFIYAGRLHSSPVANTFLLWVLFISISDGTLDGNLFLIAAGTVVLGAIELALRASRKVSARVAV